MEKQADAKWVRVRNPDYWNGFTDGFNETNSKMVCAKCHREFPFDLKCPMCGSSKLVLATAAETPGIFCSVCHWGQWHWDCPTCGRRQDFAPSFFYNKKAIAIGARSRVV
jgi:rubredoxin